MTSRPHSITWWLRVKKQMTTEDTRNTRKENMNHIRTISKTPPGKGKGLGGRLVDYHVRIRPIRVFRVFRGFSSCSSSRHSGQTLPTLAILGGFVTSCEKKQITTEYGTHRKA